MQISDTALVKAKAPAICVFPTIISYTPFLYTIIYYIILYYFYLVYSVFRFNNSCAYYLYLIGITQYYQIEYNL